MQGMRFGRKILTFGQGNAVLQSISVTERAIPGEEEEAFTRRLLRKFEGQQGTIEIIVKNGRPDYAVITFARKPESYAS